MPHLDPLSPTPSSLSFEESPKQCSAIGSYKLHYQPHRQWDFCVITEALPVDLMLILPHYRAHNQPADHRMSMYISSEHGEIKTKLCRKCPRSPFLLSVHSSSDAPITLYLPSDFAGCIRLPTCSSPTAHKPKVSFSDGFTNRILPRVTFGSSDRLPQLYPREAEDEYDDSVQGMDEVEICGRGHVTLRMWDVLEGAPESIAKEAWRKIVRKASSKNVKCELKYRERNRQHQQQHQQQQCAIDWDFLLED